MIETLRDRLRQHDRQALARLLTHVACGEHLDLIAESLRDSPKLARVIAITGSAGVGKSSLIGKLIPCVRQEGKRVAVLACDPQSPRTGGALLGDRFRMGNLVDEDTFVRSLAALGGRGAVADHIALMLRLLEVFGFDVIFLETVGAGQGDVTVSSLADVVLLLLQPESGDEVQWEKAGILELADVVAIHKADLPAAEMTYAQVQAILALTPTSPPILRVSSQTGLGVMELWQTLQKLPLRRTPQRSRSELLQRVQEELARRWRFAERSHDPKFEEIVRSWQAGRVDTGSAFERVLDAIIRGTHGGRVAK